MVSVTEGDVELPKTAPEDAKTNLVGVSVALLDVAA